MLHKQSGKVIAFLPPASNATFAAYATAFMKRYGPHGAFWKANPKLHQVPVTNVEVWNEPDNVNDWGNDINLSAYCPHVRGRPHRRPPRRSQRPGHDRRPGLDRIVAAAFPQGVPRQAARRRRHPPVRRHAGRVDQDRQGRARRHEPAPVAGALPSSPTSTAGPRSSDTWGSTKAKNVKSYAYNALIGLSKLRLSEITPFSWGDPSWGLTTGSFAKAVAKIQHH